MSDYVALDLVVGRETLQQPQQILSCILSSVCSPITSQPKRKLEGLPAVMFDDGLLSIALSSSLSASSSYSATPHSLFKRFHDRTPSSAHLFGTLQGVKVSFRLL